MARIWLNAFGIGLSLTWGLAAAEKRPLIPSLSPVGYRPAAMSSERLLPQHSAMGGCAACGNSAQDPGRPCIQKIMEFLCYRPVAGPCRRREPSEPVPPLWSWFPAGVCHAYAGCGTTCDSNAYGLTGAPGGEKQGSTAPSITGNPSTLANRGGPGTATRTLRKIRTLTDSPQISTPAMGSLSAGVVADPAASSASGTVPSSYAIPSLPVAPLLRRHTMKPVHTDESTVRPELRTYSVPR
jgi:hypothetical protein